MSRSIQFFFDFVSPFSYLAMTQLPNLCARKDATLEFKPIPVLSLMEKVGNRPTTIECPARGRYAMADLARWANKYSVPFQLNPHFQTIDSQRLLSGALAAQEFGQAQEYVQSVFDGFWVKGAAFADDQELADLLNEAGVSKVPEILDGIEKQESAKTKLLEEAEAAGVFGVPSMVVEGELYFGNDRLEFLEEVLCDD
ncbi:MAG: 2-hydroxychromene-2-carboxylate isomerase [Rhodobiaceae bacterium]|nr:2-hydroxychromene-2-carboxylate isomerase [Rhodobiaceae bacterium]